MTSSKVEWAGRSVLVTGGTRGIGRAVVDRLVAEGAWVTVVAQNAERIEALERQYPSVVVAAGDLRQDEVAARAVEACVAKFGALDALVNNAGRSEPDAWDAPDDAWREMLEVNLMSAVRMCRAAVPHLRQAAAPRIVNVGTELVYMPDDELVPYTAAKAALMSFTKSASHALSPDGILVNTVCPGTIATELSKRFMEALAEERGESLDDAVDYFVRDVRGIAIGRLGRPDEVADAILYLASAGCSFVTGAVLRCDGGSSPSPV